MFEALSFPPLDNKMSLRIHYVISCTWLFRSIISFIISNRAKKKDLVLYIVCNGLTFECSELSWLPLHRLNILYNVSYYPKFFTVSYMTIWFLQFGSSFKNENFLVFLSRKNNSQQSFIYCQLCAAFLITNKRKSLGRPWARMKWMAVYNPIKQGLAQHMAKNNSRGWRPKDWSIFTKPIRLDQGI